MHQKLTKSSLWLCIQYLPILAFIKHLFILWVCEIEAGAGVDRPSIPNTVMKNFLGGICWKRSSDRSGHCGRLKRSQGPSQNIRQNKHTWHAILKWKKNWKSHHRQQALNALLSAWDLHLIGGNTSRHWSHAGCKVVISLCGCQSAAFKRTRWQACNKHRRRSCQCSVGASAGKKESKGKQRRGHVKTRLR